MDAGFIINEQLWEFLGQNNLSVYINKRTNDWYATLYHGSDGSAYIKDGCAIGCKSCVGAGDSPIQAFDDMVKVFSGKVLRFEHWEKHHD